MTAPVGRRNRALVSFGALVAVVLASASCSRHGSPTPFAPDVPRLVLVIVVDQLLPAHLDPGLPGAIGRLAREGRDFDEAAHAHAITETCPGHAVVLSGVHPGRAGIPGNRFILPTPNAAGRPGLSVAYCVQDDTPAGRLLTWEQSAGPGADEAAPAEGRGRSPRLLAVATLGDWMKQRWPDARVFAVSAKDRSAITLGGQRPDAAYWLDREGAGAFTTSRYYLDVLPAWVGAWSRDRVLEGLPASWDYAGVAFDPGQREDDYAFESDRFSRTQPHPLMSGDPLRPSIEALEASPFLDTRTLEFAGELVAREGLGADDTPDLLALSLSATDIIGHHYGPESRESRAAITALDRALADFLERVEARVGPGRVLVVLTSDHGALPIPEWWQTHGGAEAPCPVQGGRISPAPVDAAISQALAARFGDDWAGGFVREGFTVAFDPARVERDGLSLERLVEAVRPSLEGVAGIERVWSRADLVEADDPADDSMAALLRNSFAATDRGGDVFLQPARGCLWTKWPSGTSHGSPYDYDRAVPLVFWGAAVEAGRVAGPAAPVDVAPTLAARLGIAAPGDLDGSVLPLAESR